MAMRAPKTEATGTSGQSYVVGHFEKLGWGVMPNPYHDLGTDLIAQARDDAGFDLGLLLGVQVKSGPSYFTEPCNVNGELAGWWLREDEDHFNYWLDYQAAHIVVLHDQDTGIAYWVQVSPDLVVVTGKDRKILVPADQTVDAGHQSALIKAAESKGRLPQWEGSAWEPLETISTDARLRYALVAPRLLAPHPNTQPDELDPDQAVALFVLQRFHDIGRLREKVPLLDPVQAAASTDWAWQLYGALCAWGDSGERSKLDALLATAPDGAQRAVIAVCVSHAMFEDGDPAAALAVVQDALDAAELTPADKHWLTAHKARLAFETGDLDAARESALAAKMIDTALLRDPTLRVLQGSSSELTFKLDDWGNDTLAEVVKGRDNMVNLWRNQVLSEGLGKQVEDTFNEWAPDNSVTFSTSDVAWCRFRSAMLLAGYAADSPAWRYGAVLLARRELLTRGGTSIPDHVFDLLRQSGAEKDLRRVADRLVKLGPSDALVSAATRLDLSRSTRTSLHASISLIERAGDLLSGDACDRHARTALAVLAGMDDAMERLHPRFFVGDALLKMLRSLWHGLSIAVKHEVKAHVLGLPPVGDQLVAGGYGRLIRRMDEDIWTAGEVETLAGRPGGDNFELTDAIEGLRAARSPEFRATLLDRIATGDLGALGSYGNVTHLPESVARSAIRSLAGTVANQTASARKGAYGMGGPDILRALVLLNVWHPRQAAWEMCYEALAEPTMMPEHIEGSLRLIAAVATHVEPSVREALFRPLEQIRDREEFPSAFGDSSDGVTVRGAATVALALMFPETVEPELMTSLVRGDVGERAAAARILVAQEDESALLTLATLSRDVDLTVRSTVAGGLARLVVQGIARDACLALVRDLLAEPGTEMGLAVAGALSSDADVEGNRDLADLLLEHPSAAVRAHVLRVLAPVTAVEPAGHPLKEGSSLSG